MKLNPLTKISMTIGAGLVLGASLLTARALATPEPLRLMDRGHGQPEWMTLTQALETHSFAAHAEGRCGGFMDITDFQNTDQTPVAESQFFALRLAFEGPRHQNTVKPIIAQLSAQQLSLHVARLSQFRNRYYKSPHGVESQNEVASRFRQAVQGRTDIEVKFFAHKNWPQPSVVVTIPGQGAESNQVVVIGGHADSINTTGFGSHNMHAPGADDNASGIAALIETTRVLAQTGFRPKRTLQFMAYAAEEVGLLGSQDLANLAKKEGKQVVAVMQLDMTGFPGSGNVMTLMTDFVNPGLTQFTRMLVDTYLGIPWRNSKCGYACSDHASWTRAGFASVFPSESAFEQSNKDIHTVRDLPSWVESSHMIHFTRLAVAFAVETTL